MTIRTKLLSRRWVLGMLARCTLALFTLLLGACESGGGSSDDTTEDNSSRSLRVVNAIPGSGPIGWEIAESDQGTVEYGRASAARSLIDGEKELTFYQLEADGELQYLDLAYDYDLEGDFDVLIVLYGTLSDVQIELIEVPGFDLDEDFGRIGTINLTTSTPSLDLYLTREDESVFAAASLTTAEPFLFSGTADIGAGEYDLRFTRSGEKEIVFDAGTVDIDEDTNHFFLIMDFAIGSSSLLLLEVQGDGLSRQLLDEDSPARLRLFNGIPDYPAVDLFFGDTAGEPLFTNVEFQSITQYLDIEPGDYNINVTPTGVIDRFFYEAQISVVAGNYLTLVIAGLAQQSEESPDIIGNVITDEVQPIEAGAKVSFVHASPSNESVDVYWLLPGEPVSGARAVVLGLSPFLSYEFENEPGDYRITLIQSSNDAVILGPTPISVSDGDIIEVIFTDSAGGGTPGELVVVRTDIE